MFDFYSDIPYLLLPTQDGELDGVLFDDGQKNMGMDVSVNVIFAFLEDLILNTPCWCGIVNTFELVIFD